MLNRAVVNLEMVNGRQLVRFIICRTRIIARRSRASEYHRIPMNIRIPCAHAWISARCPALELVGLAPSDSRFYDKVKVQHKWLDASAVH